MEVWEGGGFGGQWSEERRWGDGWVATEWEYCRAVFEFGGISGSSGGLIGGVSERVGLSLPRCVY